MGNKKKLIRIEPDNALYGDNPYEPKVSTGRLSFAFITPGEEVRDGIKYRKQISKFLSCREQLVEIPRYFLYDHGSTFGYSSSKYNVDMTRLRLLIANRGSSNLKEKLFSAKRLINILEEEAGWEKSIITSVKHTYFKDEVNEIFLLTGPEQWVRVPQMLSFITLVLRLGARRGPFEVNTLEDVRKIFNQLAIMDNDDQGGTDNDYISGCRKHIIALMKNIDKVFPKGSKRYYTDPSAESNMSGWRGYGGITSLFKCATGNEKLHEDFQKFVINAKKEKKDK